MHIKGEHLGVDAQARQVGNQTAEKAEKSEKSGDVSNDRMRRASGHAAAQSDAIQISKQGRDLQTQSLGRRLDAAQEQEANLQRIQEKLEQGFYESQEVLATVTERLLEDFGFPAPDSQDSSPED